MNRTVAGRRRPFSHGERPLVQSLTVLFDPNCRVCRASKAWLDHHRKVVPLRLLPVGGREAVRMFPALDMDECSKEITVITDQGFVYRGDDAFVMCLWAVRRTRSLAMRMGAGRGRMALGLLTGLTSALRDMQIASCGDQCASVGVLPRPPR